jgi:hypothetical protein
VLAVVSKKECWALAEMATDRNKWKAAPWRNARRGQAARHQRVRAQFRHLPVDMTFCADGSQRIGGMD